MSVLLYCFNRMILHQKPGWTHRSFWNLTGLSQGGDLRQNAGSVRLHVPAESGLGHTPPDLWPDEEYCRKLPVLSVLVRPRKNNIAGNPWKHAILRRTSLFLLRLHKNKNIEKWRWSKLSYIVPMVSATKTFNNERLFFVSKLNGAENSPDGNWRFDPPGFFMSCQP